MFNICKRSGSLSRRCSIPESFPTKADTSHRQRANPNFQVIVHVLRVNLILRCCASSPSVSLLGGGDYFLATHAESNQKPPPPKKILHGEARRVAGGSILSNLERVWERHCFSLIASTAIKVTLTITSALEIEDLGNTSNWGFNLTFYWGNLHKSPQGVFSKLIAQL